MNDIMHYDHQKYGSCWVYKECAKKKNITPATFSIFPRIFKQTKVPIRQFEIFQNCCWYRYCRPCRVIHAQVFSTILQECANKEDIPVLIMGFDEAEAAKLFANT